MQFGNPIAATVGGVSPPLPVPPGTPTTIFTDSNGVVWVANGGVAGGAYRQASSVLYSLVYRTAAMNWNTTLSIAPFDTISKDVYSMYVVNPWQWTLPVGGLWYIEGNLTANPTAGGQQFTGGIRINGTVVTNVCMVPGFATSSQRADVPVKITWPCSQGDLVQITAQASVAGIPATPAAFGVLPYYGSIRYVGSG